MGWLHSWHANQAHLPPPLCCLLLRGLLLEAVLLDALQTGWVLPRLVRRRPVLWLVASVAGCGGQQRQAAPPAWTAHLSQQLLHAACAVEVHEALVALKDEARSEGRQPQLRNCAVVQDLRQGTQGGAN